MPKKSMAAPCSSGKESSTRLLRSRDESTKYLRSRSSTSSENKVSKKPRKSSTAAQSVSRSPIITRSRSKSLGLQQVQPVNLVDSSMDCSSQTPVEESLKRKHPVSSERKIGENSKESVAKKAKSSSKKSKSSNMSNAPTHSKNELNSSDISSGRGDAKDTSTSKTQASDSHDESPTGQVAEPAESGSKGSTSPSSSTSDNSRSNLLETGTLSNETINNLNLDNASGNPPVEDFILACSRLSQAEATAQQFASFSCNENVMSNEVRKHKYEILKNITDRKLITNSDFQQSLLSVMQRTRNCQNNKNSETPSESRPGGSGSSEFQNVLRIKVEKDDEATKDQCKFSKTSNLRDGNSSQQSYFKPPTASSSGAQSNAFNNISVKQEMDIPSAEEIANPFLSRRIFIPDNLDSESAQGLSSANNTAAVGSTDSIDGEIGRLQALMDSRRIPISLFGALESRMQQLFHKSMGTATSSRAQQLLQELQAAEDDEHQLQVLIEISQLLVMGNEDTLIGFPVKQIVPILINLLLKEYNFELMNQACRALTYLIEALPRSSSVVVEAVPVLLNKVQVIQCIDVAEQALTALKMLSKWHSKSILQAKGVAACLMHLDFFSINAQRTALAIIANCCQNILPHEFNLVQESLTILSGWLTRQDEKSVESICLAFSGLVECFQSDRDCLMQIGSHDLLTNIQQLLVVSPPIISSQIFTTVIHMLALLCASCSEIVVFLLQQDFAETLQYLLTENCDSAKEIELTPRSPHEYLELSSLICEIMPSLPPEDLFSINVLIVAAKKRINHPNCVTWQWKDDAGFWHSHEKNDSKNIEEAYQRGNVKLYISDRAALNIDLQTMEQFDEGAGTSRQLRRHFVSSDDQSKYTRANFFEENEDLVISSIKILFPVLFEIYCSSAGSTVKQKCLRAMLRMIYFAPPDVLHQVLKKQSIARHIASMLATQEFRTVVAALQLAEILMQKLPSEFRVHFIREGVLHEVRALAKIDAKTWQIDTSVAEASTSFSSSSSPQVQSFDCLGDTPQVSKAEVGQSSSASMPVFSNAQGSSSLLKEDESNGSNVASKIRDALKRRYMTIKRTFGAGDKDVASLCGADITITADNRMKINNWIKEQAQNFDDKYFSVDQINSHPVINVLNILTKAVQGLECMDDCGLRSLIEVRDVVTQNDISSFELIHSGLVKKLEQFLSAAQGESMPFGVKSLEERLRTFLHVFIGSPLQVIPEIQPENFDAAPLVNLITKLNACVSHLEQFPVKVYDQPSNGNTGRPGASIMKFFNMHQLKCLFQRHPSCTTLRQWHSGPVMIDPLASIHNIDRYLVNQGFGSLKEDDESESDLSYDDSSDEDGGLIVADIRMDHGHGSPKLQFLIGKNVLPYNMTLYQAVRQYGNGDSQNSSNAQNLDCEYPVGYASVWLKTHTIWYRPIPPEDSEGASSNSTNTPQTSSGKKKSSSSRSSHSKSTSDRTRSSSKNKKDALWDNGIVPEVAFPSSFVAKLSGFDTIKDPSLDVIILLRVIHSLSYHWGLLYQLNSWSQLVPIVAFNNNELTLKVNRQLHDPLAIMTGNTPSWLSHIAYNFPFLFPFETRHLLFYVTSFDRERALQRLIDTVPELTNAEKITPRLEKRKRTVSRSSLLKQAETILQDHGDSKALLEIQYKNEVGTGLGPTLEFYALVSKELQRADLDMWRASEVVNDDGKDPTTNYVHSPSGLFPMPVPRNARTSSLTKVCNKFKLLGKFLAKAIMDSRLVDIPLSLAFFKWMLSQERYLSLGDLQHIDESLAHNIIKLEKIVIEKKKLEKDASLNPVALKRSLESITLDGCSIEDLSLDFTLPGYARIEMKKSGKDVPVSIHNIEDYLKLLKYWTMTEGVSKQLRAFREGFESVFSLNRLQVFYPEELAYLFCGNVHNHWDVKSLTDSCRPDHGYTHESQAIKYLFDILSSYDGNQQRQFIQFITGSPRLPIGGLKSLSPPLTIVKKTSDDETSSDNYLPSVMTCVNYLKLPDYSSIEIMREKLQIAISEGQHSFHLS